MNTEILTIENTTPLTQESLQKLADKGYMPAGFTFNPVENHYDYIFIKYRPILITGHPIGELSIEQIRKNISLDKDGKMSVANMMVTIDNIDEMNATGQSIPEDIQEWYDKTISGMRNDIKENTSVMPKETAPKRFMFKNALLSLGVSPQTADDWIKVRKAKRAAQTETAFKTVASQIKLVMDEYGVSADDVVRIAVERNWQGLMARFFENIEWKDYGIKVGQQDLPFDNETQWE